MTNLYEKYETNLEPDQLRRRGRLLIFVILLAMGLLYSMYYLRSQTNSTPSFLPISSQVSIQPRPVSPVSGTLSADELATINVFKETSKSVVYITSKVRGYDPWTLRADDIPQGTGSGFIWDKDGHIVTNYHVVAGASQIAITCSDQTTLAARFIDADPNNDIAVLQVDRPQLELNPVKIGESSNLQVGQKVLAIGNPFGLDSTLTTGIISALGRTIVTENRREIHNVIQTDAAINPGNSGGPLLDSFGRVIGVNTAIVSPTGAYAGIGFAIPIDTVNRIVPKMIAEIKTARAGLGVKLLPDHVLSNYGISGAAILQVSRGSAAERAGLRGFSRSWTGIILGDIIIEIDGIKIQNTEDLINALEGKQVGDQVDIVFIRNRNKMSTTITLQKITD